MGENMVVILKCVYFMVLFLSLFIMATNVDAIRVHQETISGRCFKTKECKDKKCPIGYKPKCIERMCRCIS
uniref:Late nodulin-like protein n=1 Tax=Astragalus sinicus TaxID=47065 RepID=Q07A39_ASTSI|nr:late nodulin-like protein [Astragalus sinicus]